MGTRPREKKAENERRGAETPPSGKTDTASGNGETDLDCPGAGAAGDLISKFSEENQ